MKRISIVNNLFLFAILLMISSCNKRYDNNSYVEDCKLIVSENYAPFEVKDSYFYRYFTKKTLIKDTMFEVNSIVHDEASNLFTYKDSFRNQVLFTIENIQHYLELQKNENPIFVPFYNICIYHKSKDSIVDGELDYVYNGNTFEYDLYLITQYDYNTNTIDTVEYLYYLYYNKEVGCFLVGALHKNIREYLRNKRIFKDGKLVHTIEMGNIPFMCFQKTSPFELVDD